MKFTFRPLQDWGQPKTPAERRRSRNTFKASHIDTMDRLRYELELLGARDGIIEADLREQDIRIDGMPRANAPQPKFPGIRVSFESRHGPLQYQTDVCERYEHNLRSIALGLEALRAVDRYGITSRAEQYTGFKAIAGKVSMTEQEAIDVLTSIAGYGLTTLAAYSLARRRSHPDHHGGDRTQWDRVEEAAKILGYL